MGKDKSRPIFGLGKIPEKELLRLSRVEVGQLKSYIDELEDENEKLSNELSSIKSLSRQERKELKERYYQQALWAELEIKNNTLTTENAKLKKQVERLFAELVKIRNNGKGV